jgi:hypothetical protein
MKKILFLGFAKAACFSLQGHKPTKEGVEIQGV